MNISSLLFSSLLPKAARPSSESPASLAGPLLFLLGTPLLVRPLPALPARRKLPFFAAFLYAFFTF